MAFIGKEKVYWPYCAWVMQAESSATSPRIGCITVYKEPKRPAAVAVSSFGDVSVFQVRKQLLLMIDIFHDFIYQNIPGPQQVWYLVVSYVLGDAGFTSSTVGFLALRVQEPMS